MARYCRALTIRNINGVEIHSYGIELIDIEDGRLRVMDGAYDMTGDVRKINRYVEAMNRCALSPVHFWDVVEDLL